MKHLKTITLAITLSLSHSQTFAMEIPTHPEQTHPNETAQDPGALIQQALANFRGDGLLINRDKAEQLLKQATNLNDPDSFMAIGDAYTEMSNSPCLYNSCDSCEKIHKPFYKAQSYKYYAKASQFRFKKEALEKLGRTGFPSYTEKGAQYHHFPDFVKGQYVLSQLYKNTDGTYFSEIELDLKQRKSLNSDLLLKSANNGFPPAQYDLGQWFSTLSWKKENMDNPTYFSQTLFWFKKAARQGHAESCLSLGEIYYHAPEWLRDKNKSRKYFLKACEINLENYIKIGDSYKEGKSFCHNGDMIKDIYQAACWYELALKYYYEKVTLDIEPNVTNFLEKYPFGKAENGDPKAQHKVGILYLEDKEIPMDSTKGFEFLRLSTQQGHIPAQLSLGKIYMERLYKTKQDLDLACYWFTQAHEGGDSSSLLDFAKKIYNQGYIYGVNHYKKEQVNNNERALKIIQQLCDAGNAYALAYLGKIHCQGEGVPVNKIKALQLFLESAKKQNKTVIPEMKVLFEGRNHPTIPQELSSAAVEEIHAFRESCEGLNGYYLDFLSKFNGHHMPDCFGQCPLIRKLSNNIANMSDGYMKILDNIHKAGFLGKGFSLNSPTHEIWIKQISPYFSLTVHNQKIKFFDEYISLVWDGLEVINDETIEAHFTALQDINAKAIDLLEKCDFKDNTILDVIKMSNENLHDYLSAVLQYQLKESDSDKMIEIIKVLKTHQIEIETHIQFAQQMRERLLTLLDDTQDYRNWIFHQALNG